MKKCLPQVIKCHRKIRCKLTVKVVNCKYTPTLATLSLLHSPAQQTTAEKGICKSHGHFANVLLDYPLFLILCSFAQVSILSKGKALNI